MVDRGDDLQDKLAALRRSFAAQVPDKIAEIERCCEALHQADQDLSALSQLHRLSHSLAGSGGTFGFPQLGAQARQIEQELLRLLQRDQPPSENELAQIGAMVRDLRGLANDLPDIVPPAAAAKKPTRTAAPPQRTTGRRLYLLEEDQHLAHDMALQVGHFGYEVSTFASAVELERKSREAPPAAAVMDIALHPDKAAEIEIIRRIRQPPTAGFPIVFLCSCDDLETRLQAVRAGGTAYFTKPVDIGALVDRLDALTSNEEPEPYRILVVDDDTNVAAHHSLVLRDADMKVESVTQPMQAMSVLAEFKPELILMDLYMPQCTGLELAKVIRQQEAYLSIPIVFLSAETDVEKQFAALRLGGDDFLTKPIQDDHLISSVLARAQRFRLLSSMMIRDSLTGLLKHTKIKEELQMEILRARRQWSALSFAMIDIDRFKTINDTHGHLCGDRVIKSLSRLLQQRLRRTDIIGRYGGEEFAVIFPGTDHDTAAHALDTIRADFAEIHHLHAGKEFSASFSAGIADFPRHPDSNSLIQAADAALYDAKNGGRNRVITAGS